MKKPSRIHKNGSNPAAALQIETHQSRARAHPAIPAGRDSRTLTILSAGDNGRLERDLEGRLLFVWGHKCGENGVPYHALSRREIGYSEAVDFVAKYSYWKDPRRLLTLHGIKAPSPALAPGGSGTAPDGRRARGQAAAITHPPRSSSATLELVDPLSRESCGFLEFSPDEFIGVLRACLRSDLTVPQLIESAVRERILMESLGPNRKPAPAKVARSVKTLTQLA